MAVIEHDPERVAIEDRGLAAFRKGGVPAYAQVRLAAIASGTGVQMHSNDIVPSEWYSFAGESGRAMKEIRSAYANHGSYVSGLAVLPDYEGLQGNTEYRAVLASVGIHSPIRNHK